MALRGVCMITHVASTTNGATSGTAITCSAPAGISSGDVLIGIIHNNSTPITTDNNGSTPMTKKYGLDYAAGSAYYSIWYRVAGSSEPATYAFTADASQRWSIIISAYRGVDAAIWDVEPSATTDNQDDISPFATDALTTIVDGAMIVACAFTDSSTITYTATPADSFNNRQNNSGEQVLALSDKLQTVAGVQSAVSWTGSASDTSATQIFSLKPESGAIISTQDLMMMF